MSQQVAPHPDARAEHPPYLDRRHPATGKEPYCVNLIRRDADGNPEVVTIYRFANADDALDFYLEHKA